MADTDVDSISGDTDLWVRFIAHPSNGGEHFCFKWTLDIALRTSRFESKRSWATLGIVEIAPKMQDRRIVRHDVSGGHGGDDLDSSPGARHCDVEPTPAGFLNSPS